MPDPQELMNRILENFKAGVLAVSTDGSIVFANSVIETFIGLEKGTLQGTLFRNCLSEDTENPEIQTLLTELLENPSASCDRIVKYKRNKDVLQLRIRKTFLPDFGTVFLFEDFSKLSEFRASACSLKKIKSRNERLENRNRFLNETFGRYLSNEIVEELTNTPGGLDIGGKKVNLTVLISDLRGSTSIADSMDANQYLKGLNHYFEEMTDAIRKYKGTVIEFVGDSILAIFGTPIPCENHALQAVGAAVEMQKRMEKVNAWNRENSFPVYSMGIGINTGDVILGNIGSKRHAKYGVTGYIVNLCSRIESYALGGQILTGDYTVSRITSPLQIRSKISVFPKGATSPFTLYDIYGVGDPFHISFDTYSEKLTDLDPPIPIEFSIIQGSKNVELETHSARISRLSTTNAVLCTDTPLEQYMDLQFRLSSNSIVYGKVTNVSSAGAHIVFTSVPVSFLAWCSSLTKH